jgi:hypothetical protein
MVTDGHDDSTKEELERVRKELSVLQSAMVETGKQTNALRDQLSTMQRTLEDKLDADVKPLKESLKNRGEADDSHRPKPPWAAAFPMVMALLLFGLGVLVGSLPTLWRIVFGACFLLAIVSFCAYWAFKRWRRRR